MSSTMSILESARSGLNAAQLGLSVTSQNIANADTEGYTRQVLSLSAKSPDTGAYRSSNVSIQIGGGVSIDSVYQVRNSFLDVRYRYENSSYNLYSTTQSLMSPIEDRFNEINDSTTTTNTLGGLSGSIDDLITSLQAYQNSPTNTSIAQDIETKVDYLASTIRNDAKALSDALTSANKELNIYVNGGVGDTSNGNISGGINGMIEQIQSLNTEIASYEVTGQKANDLRDQRNLLLDKLSSYMDIDTTEQANGMVTVKLLNDDSKSIIDAGNNATIFQVGTDAVSGATALQWGDSISASGVRTTAASTPTANLCGGIIKAYLNVINGDGTGTSDTTTAQCGDVGIPYLQKKLNEFAVAFLNIMNNANGVVNSSDTLNTQFLTYAGYDPTKTTADMLGDNVAATLKVTDAWKNDSELFIKNYTGADAGTYFSDYIYALSNTTGTVTTPVSGNPSKTFQGSFRDFADSFTQDIGSQISTVKNKAAAAQVNSDNLDAQRQSISSVSTNDEGVNLIKYQQAYNACARVITVIDEMLDKLINGTGTVGL